MSSHTYLVTRHPGALEWLRRQGYANAEHVQHLRPHSVQAGDIVVGTLPINLVADLCERGASYLHLSIELPADMRGLELNAQQLVSLGARLEGYIARQVPKARPHAEQPCD